MQAEGAVARVLDKTELIEKKFFSNFVPKLFICISTNKTTKLCAVRHVECKVLQSPSIAWSSVHECPAVNQIVLNSKAFYAFQLCPTNIKLEVKGYHIIEGLAIYIGKDNYL